MFDIRKNIYWIVLDTSTAGLGEQIHGIGRQVEKIGGYALVPNAFHWTEAAHELGHAFGLLHNFKEDDYLSRTAKAETDYLLAPSHFWLHISTSFPKRMGKTTKKIVNSFSSHRRNI